jgi:uncharacterized protein YcfJ
MRKLLFIVPTVLALGACDTMPSSQDRATIGGAAAGAVLGAAVSNDEDRTKGVLAGAAAGALAGRLLSQTQSGACLYERPDGSQYQAACP